MMKKKTKLIIGSIVVVLVVAVLIFSSAMDNMQYYKTVEEVLSMGDKAYSESLRMSGKVADGSIQTEKGKYKLTFNILSKDGNNRLAVGYNGAVPDTFKPGIEVIIEGKLDKENIFSAEKLLTKCPSKYKSDVKKS